MTSSSSEKSSWWICNLSKTHLLSVKWASIGWTRRAGVWDAEMQSLGPPRDLQVGKKLEPVEPQSLGRLLLFSFIVAHTAIATWSIWPLLLHLKAKSCSRCTFQTSCLHPLCPTRLLLQFCSNGDPDPHFCAAAHQKTTFLACHPDWPPSQVLQLAIKC